MEELLNFILTSQTGVKKAKIGGSDFRYSFDGNSATFSKRTSGVIWLAIYGESRETVLVMAIESLMDSRKLYAVVQKAQSGVNFPALAACSPLEIQLGQFYAAQAEIRKKAIEGLV